MTTYNMGIAGCGWISNHAHIRALNQTWGPCIKSIYDKQESALTTTGNHYNIKGRYHEYSEFLKSDIQGINLATPNYTHKNYIIQSLQHKKWLLCEKPIVLNEAELLEIREKVGDNVLYHVPAFVNRFRYDIKLLYRHLKQIGQITRIKAKWIRKSGVPRPGTWFTNKQFSGGGVLIDLGSHMIDICLNIIKTFQGSNDLNPIVLEKRMKFCSGDTKSHSGANWFLKSDNNHFAIDVESNICSKFLVSNVLIDLELCWTSDDTNDYTQFTVYGTTSTVQLDTLFGFSNCREFPNSKITVFKNNKTTSSMIPAHQNTQLAAFINMHSYFNQCVLANNNSTLTIEDAEIVIKTIDSIYKF